MHEEGMYSNSSRRRNDRLARIICSIDNKTPKSTFKIILYNKEKQWNVKVSIYPVNISSKYSILTTLIWVSKCVKDITTTSCNNFDINSSTFELTVNFHPNILTKREFCSSLKTNINSWFCLHFLKIIMVISRKLSRWGNLHMKEDTVCNEAVLDSAT